MQQSQSTYPRLSYDDFNDDDFDFNDDEDGSRPQSAERETTVPRGETLSQIDPGIFPERRLEWKVAMRRDGHPPSPLTPSLS